MWRKLYILIFMYKFFVFHPLLLFSIKTLYFLMDPEKTNEVHFDL